MKTPPQKLQHPLSTSTANATPLFGLYLAFTAEDVATCTTCFDLSMEVL